MPATTGEPIRPVTASRVQAQRRAITGVLLPQGVTRSPGAHRVAAALHTIVREVHRAVATALIVVRAVPVAVAALTVVRVAPAAVHTARLAEAVVLRVAAAVRTARLAEAVVLRVAAVADPRVVALQVHQDQVQVQDVKLSLTAGIRSSILALYNSNRYCYEKDFIYSPDIHMFFSFCGSTK